MWYSGWYDTLGIEELCQGACRGQLTPCCDVSSDQLTRCFACCCRCRKARRRRSYYWMNAASKYSPRYVRPRARSSSTSCELLCRQSPVVLLCITCIRVLYSVHVHVYCNTIFLIIRLVKVILLGEIICRVSFFILAKWMDTSKQYMYMYVRHASICRRHHQQCGHLSLVVVCRHDL